MADPALPFDTPAGGSDTGETEVHLNFIRQHPAIEIRDEDGISDDAIEIWNYLSQQSLTNLMIMGFATNVCVIDRPFGIKQMVRWRLNVLLLRDLTDAVYNPATPPYVSHEEGTQLAIGYIEKFWCPTISSDDLLATL